MTSRLSFCTSTRTLSKPAPRSSAVMVSTLAAREPRISDYAASKRAGEDSARGLLGSRITVLRPAAVYGPADPETLRLFQLSRQPIVPLPEGASYLGFIFACGDDPAMVETALREAHSRLRFEIRPQLSVIRP